MLPGARGGDTGERQNNGGREESWTLAQRRCKNGKDWTVSRSNEGEDPRVHGMKGVQGPKVGAKARWEHKER